MQREHCVNIGQYCQTVAEVCGTWLTKYDARALLPVDARSDKITIRKKSSDKCIYFQTKLSAPSLKLVLARFLALIQCPNTPPICNQLSSRQLL